MNERRQTTDSERDPLGLSHLPPLEHPDGRADRDDWNAIAATLEAERAAQRRRWQWGGLAVAASLVAMLVWTPLTQRGSDVIPTIADVDPGATTTDAAAQPEPVEQLIALSQRMESQLRVLAGRRAGVSAEEAAYQAELEDLIAQVDARISVQPDSPVLWDQRLNLQLDLARLYEHGLRRDYGLVASL